jgi:hypothetical protein
MAPPDLTLPRRPTVFQSAAGFVCDRPTPLSEWSSSMCLCVAEDVAALVTPFESSGEARASVGRGGLVRPARGSSRATDTRERLVRRCGFVRRGRVMAPGGVEPPHADSKSAALSAELRGPRASVAPTPAAARRGKATRGGSRRGDERGRERRSGHQNLRPRKRTDGPGGPVRRERMLLRPPRAGSRDASRALRRLQGAGAQGCRPRR